MAKKGRPTGKKNSRDGGRAICRGCGRPVGRRSVYHNWHVSCLRKYAVRFECSTEEMRQKLDQLERRLREDLLKRTCKWWNREMGEDALKEMFPGFQF